MLIYHPCFHDVIDVVTFDLKNNLSNKELFDFCFPITCCWDPWRCCVFVASASQQNTKGPFSCQSKTWNSKRPLAEGKFSTIACGDWWHIVFYLLQIQGEFDWICKKTKNNKRTVPGNGILHVTFDSADSYSLQPIPIPRAPTCGPSEKRRKASLSPGTRGICPGTDAWSFRWH